MTGTEVVRAASAMAFFASVAGTGYVSASCETDPAPCGDHEASACEFDCASLAEQECYFECSSQCSSGWDGWSWRLANVLDEQCDYEHESWPQYRGWMICECS